MKKLALVTMSAVFVGSMAFAADAEDKSSATVDHSKNPITGTETTKKVSKKKMKDGHGNEAAMKVTDKTKVHTDGKVEHTQETEKEATHK